MYSIVSFIAYEYQRISRRAENGTRPKSYFIPPTFKKAVARFHVPKLVYVI